jgi:hypothetical protein
MELFDINEYDLQGRLNQFLSGETRDSSFDDSDFDDLDNLIDHIDFSDFEGNTFKDNFAKVKSKIKKVIVPGGRKVIVEGRKSPQIVSKKIKTAREKRSLKNKTSIKPRPDLDINGIDVQEGEEVLLKGRNKKVISKVLIPRDRNLIVEGASKLMLSEDKSNSLIKQLGYFNGKKLQELIIEIDNQGENDFVLSLFDPSMPMDYLYSTSQNLNNRITVGGGALQYSDLMFNQLANPLLIHSAYFTFEGSTSQVSTQESLAMQFVNKNTQGYKKVDPVNLSLKIDTMQFFNNVIAFDLHESLNRPFIPDGMDVINYTIFAGVKATLVFFYEQIHIKDVFYEEARKSKLLL